MIDLNLRPGLQDLPNIHELQFTEEEVSLEKSEWEKVFYEKSKFYNDSDLLKIKNLRRKYLNRISAKKSRIRKEQKLLLFIEQLQISNAQLYIENQKLKARLNNINGISN